jgi:hypothetical protein
LPIPDAPGVYMIAIVDQAGMLRATTGFEVTGGDAAPTTSTAAEQIEITPIGTTQFGTGCFISAELTGPAGSAYRMTIPVTATADGQELRGVVEPDKPLAFEIYSFGSTGQSTANLMLMAACSAITLDFGLPECRFAEGDGTAVRDCPAQVHINPMREDGADGALGSEDGTEEGMLMTDPRPPKVIVESGPPAFIVTEVPAPPASDDVAAYRAMTPEEIDAAFFALEEAQQ